MRWGELMGLRRADFDLEQASVKIERSAVESGTRIVIKATKTPAGVRSVALPAWLVPELAHHRDTSAEPGSTVGYSLAGTGDAAAAELRDDLEAGQGRSGGAGAGRSPFPRPQHTGNHFAAASGASTRELMGRMGHASMRAALIYQHRTVERDRVIADALDSILRAGE